MHTYVPGWRSIAGLGNVMVTLAMTTEVENSVSLVGDTVGIQDGNLVLETLPLGLGARGIEGRVRVIGLANQAKVCRGLCRVSLAHEHCNASDI